MPRVTQAHLDTRRRQILDASRRCFVRNGFHATSMQDVVRESGLSTGAVYRYFGGKAELVGAIVDEVLAELDETLPPLGADDEPPQLDEAVAEVLATLQRLDEERGVARIAVQVWGEAAREPLFAARVAEVFGRVHGRLTAVVEAHQARGTLAADVPAADVARVLTCIPPGFALQRALLGDADAAPFAAALRALRPAAPGDSAA